MSSGRRRMIANFRERVISTDANRADAFKDAAAQQVLRRMYDDTYQSMALPGQNVEHSTVGAPLSAVVFGGLIPEPVSGTQINVSAGTMSAIFPAIASSADDSPYVFVDDLGSFSDPAMVFTANAGPGRRIDVIECQPTDTVTATDNRDVFDPTTGLFSPVTVNKVAQATLTYRIRLGTAGAGYPGHASGWLPLTIVMVPSGAADWSDCCFWDVRPLVTDRVSNAGSNDSREMWMRLKGSADLGLEVANRLTGQITTVGAPILSGGDPCGPYEVGGILRPGVPGAGDVDYFTINSGINLTNGYSPLNGTQYAVAAFFPEGLPRWVRYNEDPATFGGRRLPWGMKGILQVLATSELHEDGLTNSMALNSATGLTTGAVGICLYIGQYESGFGTGMFRDGTIWLGNPIVIPTTALTHNDSGNTGGDTTLIADVGPPNTTLPRNVFAALFTFEMTTDGYALAGGVAVRETQTFEVQNSGGTITQILRQLLKAEPLSGAVGDRVLDGKPEVWVPIPHNAFLTDVSAAWRVKYTRAFFFAISGTTAKADWTIRAIKLQP